MKIVLDAMGGDNAPLEVVKGAILAVNEFKKEVILVGDETKIKEILKENNALDNKLLSIVHSDQVITMSDSPKSVLKEKRNSSIGMALDLVAEGKADAFVSAGNTGAVLTGSTLIVKRIKGIRRAALAPMLPTKSGGSLLVDCGANVECTEEYLLQFAIMGSIYFGNVSNNKNPKVGLVNNGAESSKGTPMHKKTYKMLENIHNMGIINFTGNIEGRDIPQGVCDVLVTDGFTGNILLKTYEGVGLYIASEMKKMFMKNIISKISALLVKNGIDEFKKTMDYKEVGGAPLLGIKKPVIKAHGSSNAYAIRSAIKQAIVYTESKSIEAIEKNINKISEKLEKN